VRDTGQAEAVTRFSTQTHEPAYRLNPIHKEQGTDMNNIKHQHIARIRLTAGLLAGAATLLGLMATPAVASTTQGGCTVTPQKPIYAGFLNDAGDKIISYRVTVSCASNRTAIVTQQGAEEDWSTFLHTDRDDTVFWRKVSVRFVSAGTTTLSYVKALPDTEDGKEEIYQKVLFQVSSNGVTSAPSAWERTPYVSFFN
jgi:hypothetical protein